MGEGAGRSPPSVKRCVSWAGRVFCSLRCSPPLGLLNTVMPALVVTVRNGWGPWSQDTNGWRLPVSDSAIGGRTGGGLRTDGSNQCAVSEGRRCCDTRSLTLQKLALVSLFRNQVWLTGPTAEDWRLIRSRRALRGKELVFPRTVRPTPG